MNNSIVETLKESAEKVEQPSQDMNLLETDNVACCCIIVLGTGCDALPNGIKGVGPSFIRDKVAQQKLNNQQLIKLFSSKSNIPEQVLHSYLASMMYKPGDTVDNVDMNNC